MLRFGELLRFGIELGLRLGFLGNKGGGSMRKDGMRGVGGDSFGFEGGRGRVGEGGGRTNRVRVVGGDGFGFNRESWL